MRFDYYTIIPQTAEPRVLLLPRSNGWTLPHFEMTEKHFWQAVDHVNQAMRDSLGIDMKTLRCVNINRHPETQHIHLVYEMENHSPDWRPTGRGRWFERDALEDLTLAIPEHHSILKDWFARIEETEVPATRVSWYKRGWFNMAAIWIHDQLDRLGFTPTASVEQLRSWQRSSLLRVNTTAGYIYFKAVPGMFAHEPILTKGLAEWYPAHFPVLPAPSALDADGAGRRQDAG